MRKPLVALAVLSCFGLPACEDGPTQTFSPINGNGLDQDNGDSPPAVAGTQGNFQTQGGGQNEMVICNATKEAQVWKNMVQAPITPPRYIGLLDLAGGSQWPGLTIEQAEQTQCQSTNEGDVFGDGNQYNQWGDNGEVGCDYNVSNHLIYFCNAWPGYVGATTFKSRDGKDTFRVPIVTGPITKNGQNYQLNWTTPAFKNDPEFNMQINELYDGLSATYTGFAPTTDCQGIGACIAGNFGAVAYMYFPGLGVGWWIENLMGGQPEASTMNRIDQYLAKVLPFSFANPVMKLDAPGPIAPGGKLDTATTPCNLQMGITYGNFLSDCVQVTGNTTKNALQQNMLLGGLTHDTETWSFNVQGVDINFRDNQLTPTTIVTDQSLPTSTDPGIYFNVDQSTLGVIANDYANNNPADPGGNDLHATGLVYLEYARLSQENLNQYVPVANRHPLGDPACLWPSSPPPANWTPAPGCTGMEGFITMASIPDGMTSMPACPVPMVGNPLAPAPDLTTCVDGPNIGNIMVGPALGQAINPGFGLGLKPGHPAASFCWDANGDFTNGYMNCPLPANASGDIFSTSFAQVVAVMGQGNIANMPADVQDVRFFWKQYATALIKYLQVSGGPDTSGNNPVLGAHENPIDIDTRIRDANNVPVANQYTYTTVDSDDLYYDSIGDGQFEIAEYVQRNFVTSSATPPTDIVFTADVKDGIFDAYDWSRELYRGETAIYQAVAAKNPSTNMVNPPGADRTALLTNVFGSPLLASLYASVPGAAGAPGYSAYYCATNYDPADCEGQLPPLDANGNMLQDDAGEPLLTRYPAAFAGYGTAFTLGQDPQPISVTATFDEIQQATVTVPVFETYYDPSSKLAQTLTTLLPWTPQQPGIGFGIPLTGTLDQFIETANIDFSGTTISASVDYMPAIDPNTDMPSTSGAITFVAVETENFLGDVFVCAAPNPSTGLTDILNVRMYTPVAQILDWLESHPGSYGNCGIIITHSPYDNYADYVTSTAYGVTLNITQGGGFGRVVDVTLFVPGTT